MVSRPVFWLGFIFAEPLPGLWSQWDIVRRIPLTALGTRRVYTAFPILPLDQRTPEIRTVMARSTGAGN